MRRNRIVYCSWLAENRRADRLSRIENEPEPIIDFESLEAFDAIELEALIVRRQGDEHSEKICPAVQAAVEKLSEDEREFLSRFYHMGESYRQLSEKSGRTVHSLESLHRRAKRKLRKLLASFVAGEFGIKTRAVDTCVICRSAHRAEIDNLINGHSPEKTWRGELRTIKAEFGLTTVTPATIIGHRNYHS